MLKTTDIISSYFLEVGSLFGQDWWEWLVGEGSMHVACGLLPWVRGSAVDVPFDLTFTPVAAWSLNFLDYHT